MISLPHSKNSLSLSTGRLLLPGVLCAGSGLCWICVPAAFQRFLEALMSAGIRGAWAYAVMASAVVVISTGIDIYRFRYFLNACPALATGGSIASHLAHQRILSITVPNAATNLIIAAGGLICLLIRDWHLAAAVSFWAAGSYALQSRIAQNVDADARQLRDVGNIEEVAMATQSRLLRWQVIGGLLNSVLKIVGQIGIYSLCFALIVSGERQHALETVLPRAMANMEYVGLTLAGLQIVFSSISQLREVTVYTGAKGGLFSGLAPRNPRGVTTRTHTSHSAEAISGTAA